MIRVEANVLTSGVSSATAAAEIIAGSSVPLSIVEIDLFLNAATASTYGVGVPGAIGITPGTETTPVLADPTLTYTVTSRIALTWGTGPTVPATFIKKISLPATVGTGIIWTWPLGELVIPAGKTLVIWNGAANAAIQLNIAAYEF